VSEEFHLRSIAVAAYGPATLFGLAQGSMLPVIALSAIGLNLLSAGAAYGVLVLVFQHTWAEGLLGFHSTGGIVAWLPVILFVTLFGLSMDYHVFVVSRIREATRNGVDNVSAMLVAAKTIEKAVPYEQLVATDFMPPEAGAPTR